MSVVITKENFIPTMGEINGKEFGVFTETTGYRSAKKLIEGFLQAGQANIGSQVGAYDSEDYDPIEDSSLYVRDMELSEIGAEMARVNESLQSSSSSASEAMKGVQGETVASVSPDDQLASSAD